MNGRFAVVSLGVVALVLVTTGPAAAQAGKCTATKLRAACKKAACKAGLESKEAAKGTAIDPAKLAKCEAKFNKAFAKAESKPGCATTGDAAAIEAKVDAYVADLATELDVGTGTNPNKCEGAKIKAAGKKTNCKCALEAKQAQKGGTIDPLKIAKCESGFTNSFSKAESKGGCNTTGDAAAIEAKVDAFIADARTELEPGVTTTTTTTSTTTTTTCPTPAPPSIKGALAPATDGSFNYALTPGLAGANIACATLFACTHACTYAELQAAQGAGELVGLQDAAATPVTSFWAIDPTANPLTTQCHDDVAFPCPGGICPPGHTWEYGTAHTPSRGQKVALDNGTGALGPLQTGLQCNFSGNSWVGCCE
jgi:hypothetical protein